MSDHPTHPDSAADLDANVDALADQLGIQTEHSGESTHGALATIDAPAIPNPPSTALHADDASSPDALLSEISREIEHAAPGPLPTPPEPPPVAYTPPAPLPTDEDIAAAAAEVDADLGAFEAPTESEIAHVQAPLPSPPSALSAASPSASPERPGPEIKKLDAALAAGAERALASAKHDEPKAETAPAPAPADTEPEFEPELHPEPLEPIVLAPAPVAPPAPAKAEPKAAPAPKPASTTVVLHEPAAAPAPSRIGPAVRNILTLPFRPIAALHEKLAEPTRQTIAYSALITLFFAACVWGRVIFFPAKANLEPHGEAAEFYDDTKPAHGITAPAKHTSEAAGGHADAGHGESAGHGDAKKADSHAKPEKKSSGGHGEEAHAKPEKKSSSRAKKTASADAHGGH